MAAKNTRFSNCRGRSKGLPVWKIGIENIAQFSDRLIKFPFQGGVA